MMGVQSETYESCCRPCSPIIWGDMPRNAEKRRETPRTQASESASRDAKMVTMENQVRSFTFGHTRAAAVRSQRCGHSVAFQHLTPRFRDMRRVSHGDRPSRQGASTDMQSSHPCRCVISRHPMPLRACGFHTVLINSNPQIDTAFHGAACLAKHELLCNHSSVVEPCQNDGMLVDIVTRSNNKVPYYERLRDARHCIQLRFDKIESPFGTSSIHNTNDQPMEGQLNTANVRLYASKATSLFLSNMKC